MSNPVVMVIDDDGDIRDILRILLEQSGYAVLSASDGAQALRLLRSGTMAPGLIFLDLRMPVMNGWQFHEEQARNPEISSIPTVIITADRAALASSEFKWAQGIIPKPFQLDELLDITSRYVRAN